ncbi:M56 family metallopeptidase [Caldalkalibacillus mannanilyticus]|uniref:M56 family metallopeptidase n=1 Tax=Caldalkalibacillus mannanilyticus TaxID=1418 RepID=UPI000469D117|nr:M56 family metallopeptidase [Caldalkalibacillus mannanilyticus]
MSIVQMSLSASVLIVAIVLIRSFTLHKLPKKTFLFLWGVVILRLLVPFSIPSQFSFYTGIDMINHIFIPESSSARMTSTQNVAGILSTAEPIEIGTVAVSISPIEIVWFAGLCACVLFFTVAYIYYYREFRMSLPVENDFAVRWLREHPLRRSIQIRQSDRIITPLTYGVFHPVILFPKKTDWTEETKLQYVLTHELVHIRRFDTLTKLVLIAAVCVHWFNPFVWLMYVLVNRDIELCCDETVMRKLGETKKTAYALTLIELEEKKRYFIPLISGFSRNALEERIVSIMKMKKSTSLVTVLAIILVALVATACATTATTTPSTQDSIITTTGATIIPTIVSDGTHFDVQLIEGGVFVIGRETWNKGEEVIFNISADKNMELNIGILPAESMDSDNGFEYNGYGVFIHKKIDVNSEGQQLSFIVPELGEYGIGVQHVSDENDQDRKENSITPEMDASLISGENDLKATKNEIDPTSIVSFDIKINKVFKNPLVK